MGCTEAILQCITKFSGKASASSSVKSASISHRPQLFLQGGDAIGIRRVGREKFDRLAPLLLLSHGLPERKCRPRVTAVGGGKAAAWPIGIVLLPARGGKQNATLETGP